MVDEFTAALSRGDGDATCDYMTEGLINKFEVPGISHCAGLLGEHLGSLVVSKVTVTGEEATIAFEGYDTSWQAVKVGDEWLLDEIR
ncbi:MAG: hypothetical protein QOI31_2582 [Solirubrobacterales bacterium]|nr:hypothetical protein [Solirubrobacterales bacterium]